MAVTMILAALALLTWPVAPGVASGQDRPRSAVGSRGRDVPDPAGTRTGATPALASLAGRRRLIPGVVAGVGLGVLVSWPCGIAAAVTTVTVMRLLRRARSARRARADLVAATAGLRALARELRAGAAAADALQRIEPSMPPPVAGAVRGLVVTAPGEASTASGALLDELRARLRSAGRLSAAHGVPLSAVVQSLAADLADRVRIAEATEAQVAGPAMSGYLLAALPVGGLLLGAGMGTDPLGVLTGSAIGGGLLVVGTLLCCAGLLWTDRIVRG